MSAQQASAYSSISPKAERTVSSKVWRSNGLARVRQAPSFSASKQQAASGSAEPAGGHGDDGCVLPGGAQGKDGFYAVLAGHDQVDQEKIEGSVEGKAVGCFAVIGGDHVIAFGGKKLLEEEQGHGLVVHDKDSFFGFHMR